MCLAPVPSSQPPEASKKPAESSPREQLSNNMARIFEMQRRTNEVSGCGFPVAINSRVMVCVLSPS